MKKNPFHSVFFSLFVLVLSIGIVWNGFNLLVSCFSYSKVTPDNYQILRIIFYGSSDNPEGETVSANITLLDRKGGEIVRIERSWPDPFLAVDFANAVFNGHNYYFPEKLYGTNSVISRRTFFRKKIGTNLVPYYIENGECLFGTYRQERRALFKIANFVLNPLSVIFSGISRRYTVNLSLCKSGIYYGIFVEDGRLVLRKE